MNSSNAIFSRKLLSNRKALYLNQTESADYASEICSNEMLFTFATEMADLGYQFSPTAVELLRSFSVDTISCFRSVAIHVLKASIGADKKYVPLFRHFPDSIPDRTILLSTAVERVDDFAYALYFNIYGSWSSEEYNGTWFGRHFPECELMEPIDRPALLFNPKLTVLDIVGNDVVLDIFRNLLLSPTSMSDSDREFVKEVIHSKLNWISELPEVIPFKENAMFVIAATTDDTGCFKQHFQEMFASYILTATDVLRLAESFSGSDACLTNHVRFKLSNSQRRFLLSSLEKLNLQNALEDMLRFLGLWLVLAKYLHVNAYAKKYPSATKMVHAIRSSPKSIKTFNREVESALKGLSSLDEFEVADYSLKDLLTILKRRPGDFARRLDHLLRSLPHTEQQIVITAFLEVAPSVATPLLLNLSSHFIHRHDKAPVRVYLPKGDSVKALIDKEDSRALLSKSVCYAVAFGIDKILIDRFSHLNPLGKVYIDPILNDFIIPMGLRNTSAAMKTLGRGSKMKFNEETKVLRLFLYWENIAPENSKLSSRVDVDLSCLLLGNDFESINQIAYYNLEGTGMTHSGDFTDAPNGAAEFIDVDLKTLQRENPETRYIAVTVNAFTGQLFNTFTAQSGYMIRDGVSGESFEPKSVQHKFDVVSASPFNIPMVVDLKEREVIWLDLAISRKQEMSCVNLNDKQYEVGLLVKYAVNIEREKCSLFKLIELHAKARADSIHHTFDSDCSYDNCYDADFAHKVDEITAKYLL